MRARIPFFVALSLSLVLAASGAIADVVISSGATANMNCSGGVCTPTAKKAILNVDDLTTMLASGNVEVNTGAGKLAKQTKDIVVSAGFSWTSANSLTLDAYDSIIFDKPVADNGLGTVALTTNDGQKSGGMLLFRKGGSLNFSATGTNYLTINGYAYDLVDSVKSLVAAIIKKPFGRFALAQNYDAGADGVYYQPPVSIPFSGTFNGLGNMIINLEIADSRDGYVGLFAVARKPAELTNITIEHVLAVGTRAATGALVGENQGAIINAAASGLVRGGGAGGLVGENEGSIAFCRSNSNVEGKGDAGGLLSTNDGSLSQSFATGAVSGRYPGGLVGANGGNGVIEDSYAKGAVVGAKKFAQVGGFGGYNYLGSISTSYSIGLVSTKHENYQYAAGFLGSDEGSASDDYWDTTTSGENEGSGDGNNTGLTGLTTEQLQSGLPAGFNPAIWAEKSNINGGFPYLINNPPQN